MATIELGLHFDVMRLAILRAEKLMVCGNCEHRYHDSNGNAQCTQDHNDIAEFQGNTCDDYVFINDWKVKK